MSGIRVLLRSAAWRTLCAVHTADADSLRPAWNRL